MDGCHDSGSQWRRNKPSALASDAEFFSQESLRSGSSQANDHLRTRKGNFRFQPGTARLNFRLARPFVNAPLSVLVASPVEVLYHVGYIDPVSVDSGCRERLIENSSCGPNERMASQIFFVAGLLADEHHRSVRSTFSEYGLSSPGPEIAALAMFGRFAKGIDSSLRRQERSRRGEFFSRHGDLQMKTMNSKSASVRCRTIEPCDRDLHPNTSGTKDSKNTVGTVLES